MNYIGNELEIFQHAVRWKNYYGTLVRPYLKGHILEVGAGIGSTTLNLCDGSQESWLCVEPDPNLYKELRRKIDMKELPLCCYSLEGTLEDIAPGKKFNVILYIDVIEHIEKDTLELERAKEYLAEGGYLILLVPAHAFLFTAFDKAIGHYRRYNKKMLKLIVPKDLKLLSMKYLDSAGFLALMGNKMFLKQAYPSLRQVKIWDRCIPLSQIADKIITYQVGKTLLGIWQKRD